MSPAAKPKVVVPNIVLPISQVTRASLEELLLNSEGEIVPEARRGGDVLIAASKGPAQ